MNNKKKCPHGLDWDPVTGQHIFPKFTVKEHDDGKTYTVTEHQQEQAKQQIDTEKLLKEARSIIEYDKRIKEKEEPKPKTKREIELEESAKKWEQYFKNNPSKIPYNIFEQIERAFDY